VALAVDYLSSKNKVLSSNPSTAKSKQINNEMLALQLLVSKPRRDRFTRHPKARNFSQTKENSELTKGDTSPASLDMEPESQHFQITLLSSRIVLNYFLTFRSEGSILPVLILTRIVQIKILVEEFFFMSQTHPSTCAKSF
jgi:hypothetical protein